MIAAAAWVDTHCHLDAPEFDADRDAVAAAARAAGVATLVVPAVARSNFAAVARACRGAPGCVAAYGIHPLYVEAASESDLAALREHLVQHPAVAVGEIGLDFYRRPVAAARQEHFFGAQLAIARELGLPVLLHVRAAIDAVIKAVKRTRVVGGIAHAFNGSRVQAGQLIDLGFKLGFGGAMSHERARRIRDLAATLPLESIVLETDAPDIPPFWLAGGRNTPAELPRIAAVMAQLRGIPLGDLARATTENAIAALPALARAGQDTVLLKNADHGVD